MRPPEGSILVPILHCSTFYNAHVFVCMLCFSKASRLVRKQNFRL